MASVPAGHTLATRDGGGLPHHQGWWWATIALTLCTVSASAQSRSIVQYYTNTLAATPTNFFGSNILAGTNVHLERGPQGQLTVNASGSGSGTVVDTNAFQPAHVILTNLVGTGALTNQGELSAKQYGSLVLSNLTETGALTNQALLDAKQFGSLILTNLSGTGAFTNLLAADGGLVLHTVGGTVTVSNAVAGGGGDFIANLDGFGTNTVITNLVGLGHVQFSNSVAVQGFQTNFANLYLNYSQARFEIRATNESLITGGLIELRRALGIGETNIIVKGTELGEINFTGRSTNNTWISGSSIFSVADNWWTNGETSMGQLASLIFKASSPTTFEREVLRINYEGLTITNNLLVVSNATFKGALTMTRPTASRVAVFSAAQQLTNSAGVDTTELEFLDGVTSAVQGQLDGKQGGSLVLTNLAGTGALTNQGELDGKQFGSQILTNLSGTGALTNGSAFQPGHVVLSNAVGTGILTNGTAFQPAHVILSNAVGTGVLTNGTAFQPAHEVLTNLAGTGALTNQLAAAAPLVFTTNGATITISNATAESFFSDSWTPISDDTNTVGWWRSYAGVTYDASSNVTEVADASGFGHPLKQTIAGDYPFYLTNGLTGGRASLKFDGTADWLFTDPFAFEQPATIYFLFKGVTWSANDRLYNGLAAAGGTATNAFIYQTSSEPYLFHRTGNKVGTGLNILPTGNWGTMKAVWNVANSKLAANGRADLGGDPGGGGFGGMVIAGTEAGALNANIEWGEMIARAGTDTDDYTLKTMRYLQRASGQKFYLVVLDGNSLTAGTGLGAASLIPNKVVTNYWPTSQEWFTKNAAVGGDTTSNMIVRAAATDQYYHPNNSTNILTAWEISNELFNGISTNAAYSNFVFYCQARRAAGWKVVALTVLPRSGGSPPASFETDRLNVNLMIRANYMSFADSLADVGTNGFLGCTLCSATNTYFSDGTHLTDAGNLIVAQYITNAISRIDAGPVELTTTNTLYQTNGVNLGSGGTLNFVTGSNTLVQATNASGVNHIQINSTASGGGGDSFPAQTNLYAGFPLATDGANAFWDGPFYSARIWDDFTFSTNINARIGDYGWNVVQAGNGTFDGRPSGFGRSHVQIIRTDGGSSDITHLSQFTKSYWFGKGPVMFSTSVYVSHVPDTTQRFTMMYGFGDTHLGDATNGVYFKGDHTTDKWQFVTVTNSIAQTSVSLSNIVAGWNSLNYLINADGTEAVAYVGTSSANAYPVATNAGNIPRFEDQACMPVMHIRKTQNTDRRTNAVDYFYFHEKFTIPR